MWDFILPFLQSEQTLIQQQNKKCSDSVACFTSTALLNGVKYGCSLCDSLKSIWGLPALAGPAVEPSKPSETGWKDRTPVSWGCSSFLLGYPNLFPVNSHFIPHKTSDTGGNRRGMVLVSASIRHFYQLHLKYTWQIYIPKNTFPFIAVIVKWIGCPKTCLLRGVCVLFLFPDGERAKKRWSSTRRQVCFLHAQKESQL